MPSASSVIIIKLKTNENSEKGCFYVVSSKNYLLQKVMKSTTSCRPFFINTFRFFTHKQIKRSCESHIHGGDGNGLALKSVIQGDIGSGCRDSRMKSTTSCHPFFINTFRFFTGQTILINKSNEAVEVTYLVVTVTVWH